MTDEETLKILQSARARRPELTETLDLHVALLDARAQFEILDSKFKIPPAATTRLEHGEPLLRADELTLDWDALARLFKSICEIAARHRPDQADAFAQLAALCDQPAHAEEMAREYLASTQYALRDTHGAQPTTQPPNHPTTQPPLLAFLLNNALHPFLAAYARALEPLVDAAAWYRAYCPVCGGEPDFAALEKESGARRLLCARCDFEWTFQRAACPFCGEDAPGKLGYFPSDDGVYRLYTCENCKRYLKTIDLRELARAAHLSAERVLTIGMDGAAREAGFH